MIKNNQGGTDRERGLDVKFQRIRRITGYIVCNLDQWNNYKLSELKDRKNHM